jgi:CheY-like chemotaxis protein
MFILTVEDELLISEYLRAILEGGGHRVIATFDADEAIEALQRIDRRCDALRLTPMSRHIAAALVKLRGDADSEPASRHTGARALCSPSASSTISAVPQKDRLMTQRLLSKEAREDRRKWLGLWRYIHNRSMISEQDAKLAASLALQWLERDAKRKLVSQQPTNTKQI